jgi:hypothetical protein
MNSINSSIEMENNIFNYVRLKGEVDFKIIFEPEFQDDNLTIEQIKQCLSEHNELNDIYNQLVTESKLSIEDDFIKRLILKINDLQEEKITSNDFKNLDEFLKASKYILLEPNRIQSAKEGLPPSFFGKLKVSGVGNIQELKAYTRTKIQFADGNVEILYGVPSNWRELETNFVFLKSIRYFCAEMDTNVKQVLIPSFNFGKDSNAEIIKDKAFIFMQDLYRVIEFNGEDLKYKGDKTNVKALIRMNLKQSFKDSGIMFSNTTLMGSSSNDKKVEIDYSTVYSFLVKKSLRIENDPLVQILNSVTKTIQDMEIFISNTNNDFMKPLQEITTSPQVKYEVSSQFPTNVYTNLKEKSKGINIKFSNKIEEIYNGTNLTFVEKTK